VIEVVVAGSRWSCNDGGESHGGLWEVLMEVTCLWVIQRRRDYSLWLTNRLRRRRCCGTVSCVVQRMAGGLVPWLGCAYVAQEAKRAGRGGAMDAYGFRSLKVAGAGTTGVHGCTSDCMLDYFLFLLGHGL
jgi:hypothetical protein